MDLSFSSLFGSLFTNVREIWEPFQVSNQPTHLAPGGQMAQIKLPSLTRFCIVCQVKRQVG
jgi:hypothetical protein